MAGVMYRKHVPSHRYDTNFAYMATAKKKKKIIKKKSGNAVGKEKEQNHSDASYLGRLSEHFTHEITCISTGSRQALKM